MAIKDSLTPMKLKILLETENLITIAKKYGVSKQYISQLYFEYRENYPELFAEAPITAQWLKEQLESHSILEICNATGKSYHHIKKLMREFHIDKPTATASFDKDFVREQYVILCKSDKDLAMHYGCSVSLVKKFRYEHAILKTDRIPLTERLPQDLVKKLIREGYTVDDLSFKFDATVKEITRLLASYDVSF